MKPKYKRLRFLILCMLMMSTAAGGILYSFRDNMVFFYTPSQLAQKQQAGELAPSTTLRIGGLVKKGSIKNAADGSLNFRVTDGTDELAVSYKGFVPSLFREGQGVVAQGTLQADGSFKAATILAKHDENYMPREVVEALKQSGRWKDGAQ